MHGIAEDFTLEDVWLVPAPGSGPTDMARFLALLKRHGEHSTAVVRFLFAARWKLGKWFGWDKSGSGLDGRVPSLRERVSPELRAAPDPSPGLLRPVYVLPTEMAAETANATVHGVMHCGWVPTGDGYGLELAVYTKPNGRLGRIYMAFIKPFRRFIVWPAMLREWARAWEDRVDEGDKRDHDGGGKG